MQKYVVFDQVVLNVVFRVEKLDSRVKVKDATASIDGKNFVTLAGLNDKCVDLVKNASIVVWFMGEDRTFVVQDVEESAREIVHYLTS